jgi:hypothetical protein
MLRCQINKHVKPTRKNRMTFLKWIKSLFRGNSYQENLDSFIASKHPTSAGEVEYWVRHYDSKISKGFVL